MMGNSTAATSEGLLPSGDGQEADYGSGILYYGEEGSVPPTLFVSVFLAVIGSMGNAIVIKIFTGKPRRSSTDTLIIVLAVNDLVACMTVIPFDIKTWLNPGVRSNTDEFECGVYFFLFHQTYFTTLFLLLMIALERFLLIIFSLDLNSRVIRIRNAVILLVGIALVLSAIASLFCWFPPADQAAPAVDATGDPNTLIGAMPDPGWVHYLFNIPDIITFFLIPFSIVSLGIMYSLIFRRIVVQGRKRAVLQDGMPTTTYSPTRNHATRESLAEGTTMGLTGGSRGSPRQVSEHSGEYQEMTLVKRAGEASSTSLAQVPTALGTSASVKSVGGAGSGCAPGVLLRSSSSFRSSDTDRDVRVFSDEFKIERFPERVSRKNSSSSGVMMAPVGPGPGCSLSRRSSTISDNYMTSAAAVAGTGAVLANGERVDVNRRRRKSSIIETAMIIPLAPFPVECENEDAITCDPVNVGPSSTSSSFRGDRHRRRPLKLLRPGSSSKNSVTSPSVGSSANLQLGSPNPEVSELRTQKRQKIQQKQNSVARMLCLIAVVFLLGNMGNFLLIADRFFQFIPSSFYGSEERFTIIQSLFTVAHHLTHALNPIIYAIMSPKFRDEFLDQTRNLRTRCRFPF